MRLGGCEWSRGLGKPEALCDPRDTNFELQAFVDLVVLERPEPFTNAVDLCVQRSVLPFRRSSSSDRSFFHFSAQVRDLLVEAAEVSFQSCIDDVLDLFDVALVHTAQFSTPTGLAK